jgi:hypothetical protein
MKLPKIGIKFWMRDDESDFECTAISTMRYEFIDGTKYVDLVVEATQLNDFHISFFQLKDRTKEVHLRYINKTWQSKNRQGEWRPFTKLIMLNKPADLRPCEHTQEDYNNFIENASAYL